MRANARAALRSRARRRPKQAVPARGLWRAYKAGGDHARAGGARRPARPPQLPGAFRDAARAYRALALAAAHHDRRAWRRASARVRAAEKTVAARVNAAR